MGKAVIRIELDEVALSGGGVLVAVGVMRGTKGSDGADRRSGSFIVASRRFASELDSDAKVAS